MKIIGYILLIAILFCHYVALKHHRELAKSLHLAGSNRIQASSPYFSYKVQQRPSRNVANSRGQEGTVRYLLKHQVQQTHYDLVDPLFLLQNLVMLQTKQSIQDILDDDEKLTQVSDAVFDEVDTDKSGLIDVTELGNVMKQVAADAEVPLPTDEQIQGALMALDTNMDGVVSRPEFKELVSAILVSIAEQ